MNIITMDFSIPEHSCESKQSTLVGPEESTEPKSENVYTPKVVNVQLMQWKRKTDYKRDQRKLESLRRDEECLQEVPSINPVSRRMAEMLLEGQDRPMTYINTTPPSLSIPEHQRIKNNLKRMGNEVPQKFNIRISKNSLSISVSPNHVSKSQKQINSHFSFLKTLKKKMDRVPKQTLQTYPDFRKEKDTYKKNLIWKNQCLRKVEEMRQKFMMETDITSHSIRKEKSNKYSPISPVPKIIGFSSGKDLSKLAKQAKFLVSYKNLGE